MNFAVKKNPQLSYLLVILFSVAKAQDVRYCTSNATACDMAGLNFTCVAPGPGSTCVKEVVAGRADLALASADEMVNNMNDLKILLGEKLKDLDKFIRYYGLAVVQKGTLFNLNELEKKHSCHTGAGKTVGWKIPVGYLLYTNKMKFVDNQYQSAADYFGSSCAPGVKERTQIAEVQNDLCSLCNGTGESKCTANDPYADYVGAFRCMAEGNKDRVGFVKQTTPDEAIAKYPGLGSANDYELLCKDGSRKEISQHLSCNIGYRPSSTIVTSVNSTEYMIMMYKNTLIAANIESLKRGGFVNKDTESLHNYTGTVKDYVGDYGKYYMALTKGGESGSAAGVDNLKIVLGQKITGLDKFVRYYGLAVVKKGTPFNFKELKGKDSCHTGVLRTVGWKIPVGYLLHTKEMELKRDQFKSVSAFFGKSCAYGIDKYSNDTAVREDLCSLCKGTKETKCTGKDPYAGYEGAFICMAEGNNDRVAFVRETTAAAVFNKYPGKYGTDGDYLLLCTNGEKEALGKHKTCNIEKRPSAAVVTKKDMTNNDVKKYKRLLRRSAIEKLKSGGYVSSDIESLEEFDRSVKDYVGEYADYYLALGKTGPKEGDRTTDGGDGGGAPSSLGVPVALQVVASFSLLFLL